MPLPIGTKLGTYEVVAPIGAGGMGEVYQAHDSKLPNYDVSADGQRFLMVKPSEQAQAAPTQISVVLNWFEELKRRVPTGTK